MRRVIVSIIFRKELRETLRDRRTLLMMVGLPVVLYPALLLLAFGLASHQQDRLRARPSRVVLLGEDEPRLRAALAAEPTLTLVAPDAAAPAAGGIAPMDAGREAEARRLLAARTADAVLEVPPGTRAALAAGTVAPVRLFVDDVRDASRVAASRIAERVDAHKAALVKEALATRGLPPGVAEPMTLARRNVASPSRMGASLVAQMLPVLLVSLLVMGAFYPAIDLTAGEKERATLETLMTSPVRPLEVVAGKFLAVLAISLLATLANVASLGAALAQVVSMAPASAAVSVELPVARLAYLFVVLVPLGLLASALSLAVAVLARSFKEAQNLLTPTLLVLIVPSAIASVPGLELDPFYALVPGMNTALLTKALLLGEAKLDLVFVVVVANGVFAALALLFAARNFSDEAVLFGGDRGRRLSARRPAAGREGQAPTPAEAFLFFAGAFVLLWYGGQLLQRWDALGGLLLSQWGLLLVPVLLFARWHRYDLRATFRLRWPTLRGLAGAILVGLSMPLVVLAVSWVQELILPTPVQLQEAMRSFIAETHGAFGAFAVFFAAALTPAVCEEAVFRGLLLDAFARRLSRGATIALVALLFGAFHLSIYRVVPTALAGAALSYLVLETGSIAAGVLGHALYNGVLLAAALYLEPSFTPPPWAVGVALVVLVVGLRLARAR